MSETRLAETLLKRLRGMIWPAKGRRVLPEVVAGLGDEDLDAAAGAGDGGFGRAGGDAGHVADEGFGVADAAVEEREGAHELGREVLAAGGVLGFEERGFGGDFDGLLDVADFEVEVEGETLGDADVESGADEPFEACLLDDDLVLTDGEAAEDVEAGGGGEGV